MKHSPARLVDLVNPASLLLPASNVIMQLSHPGVDAVHRQVRSTSTSQASMAGRFNLFATKGFLPPQFRELLQVSWTDRDQRLFNTLLGALRVVDRVVPEPLWTLSYAVLIWDMRLRERMGKPVV